MYVCMLFSVCLSPSFLSLSLSLIRKPKPSDIQDFTLALTGSEWQSGMSDPINRLIMWSPSTYMIVTTVFLKILLWQKFISLFFILKVLEGGYWGSFTLRKIWFWLLFNIYVRFKFLLFLWSNIFILITYILYLSTAFIFLSIDIVFLAGMMPKYLGLSERLNIPHRM